MPSVSCHQHHPGYKEKVLALKVDPESLSLLCYAKTPPLVNEQVHALG